MDITRRDFIKWSFITGAAIAFAGCAIPPHQALVSQLELPEYRLPGDAKWYATTCQECSGGCGVSIRVIDGRAKKIEGIPEHPVNHGKVCVRAHSALQALYNPDRLTNILKRQGEQMVASQDWDEAIRSVGLQLASAMKRKGSMLWITGSLHGSKGTVLASIAEKVGAKIWILNFPGSTAQRTAFKALTGKPELPYYPVHEADYIVNFGSDFLLTDHIPVHNAWGYGEFRQGKNRRNRGTLISFSSRMSLSDSNSDRWVPVKPGTEGWVALGIGKLISKFKKKEWLSFAEHTSLETISQMTGVPIEFFGRVSKRLLEAKVPLAIAGTINGTTTNGVWIAFVIQALNKLLQGKIDSFEPDLLPWANKIPGNLFVSTKEALSLLSQGKFEFAWVLECNPRYLLPAKFEFDKFFSKVKNKVVFSPYPNETTLLADWVLPTQTWLESWGDRLMTGPFGQNKRNVRIYNLQQPVVMERSGSKSLEDLLILAVKTQDSLKKAFSQTSLQDFIAKRFADRNVWENMLVRGGAWEEYPLEFESYLGKDTHPLYPPPVLKNKGKAPSGANPWSNLKKPEMKEALPSFSGKGQILIPFYSPNFGDGAFANRPWMQELPDPLSTVVWTHWVELPIGFCQSTGLDRGDLVRLHSETGTLSGPVFPNPGLHEDAVAVPAGQGHVHYGQYANRGENPLSILDPLWQPHTDEIAWVSTRVEVEKVGKKVQITFYDQRMDRFSKEFMPL